MQNSHLESTDVEGNIDWQLLQKLCLQRGWDMRELARRAKISRSTLHNCKSQKTEKPRLSTLHKLAEALEVDPLIFIKTITPSPSENLVRTGEQPLLRQTAAEHLQPKPEAKIAWNEQHQASAFDRQTNWSVQEVCEQHPELFADWTQQEWEELFSCFGVGGELTEQGVMQQANAINQRRETLYELQVILETHLADAARRIIHSLYESVQCPDSPSLHGSQFPTKLDTFELPRTR